MIFDRFGDIEGAANTHEQENDNDFLVGHMILAMMPIIVR